MQADKLAPLPTSIPVVAVRASCAVPGTVPRKGRLAWLLALLLSPVVLLTGHIALAQGLGELTLESALNEPLRARIELIDAAGLEESQLLISIASLDEYDAAGLERSALVSQIEFELDLQPLGSGQVTLTTQDRVTEPFLNLLISARWPSGRVLRDYTVLLDLPGAGAAGNAAAVAAPVSAAASAAAPAASAAGAGSTAAAGEEYTVRAGDSLWQIAEQTRPDSGVSVPQMMIALQRANEDAFVNNNINRLVSGRVLRVPTRAEIAIIEPAAAVAQVNAQNREVGLMPLGGTGSAGAAAARDELSVLGGDRADAGAAGSSDLDATIAALEAELMLSEEELDRARLENEELTARLDELEEQIAILQNIIAIEDERIAQLQDELASQARATDDALAEASRAAELLAATEQAQAPQGLVAQLMAMLQNNLIAVGAGVAAVLALLGVLLARARKAREEADEDEFLLDEVDEPGMDDEPLMQDDRSEAEVEPEDEGSEDEEQQGFLAKLLARFRRKDQAEEADEAELGDEAFAAAAGPERSAAAQTDMEVDEILDELTGGLYADELDEALDEADRRAEAASGTAAPLEDDAEADEDADAVALASSVLDEVDSALAEIDTADTITEVSAAEPDAEQDDAAEFEFDLSADEALKAPVSSDAAADSVEFTVGTAAPAPEPETGDAVESGESEIESFAFTLEPEPAAAAPQPEAEEPVEELETFEFKPASGSDGFDLGSLTFDESDAKAAEEEESAYTPRTNMDECDTKLDLAVAYEAMGDIDGAIEILDEVIAEGKPAQIEEAQRLKAKWQDA